MLTESVCAETMVVQNRQQKVNISAFMPAKLGVLVQKEHYFKKNIKKTAETFACFRKKPYLCIAFEKKAAHKGRLERW
ncbi:MAG: hypothetical protein J6R11_03455 [Bacteroidaceae bacterium]|nr:hypothetical protein [Bacteroidaceae bacterium]